MAEDRVVLKESFLEMYKHTSDFSYELGFIDRKLGVASRSNDDCNLVRASTSLFLNNEAGSSDFEETRKKRDLKSGLRDKSVKSRSGRFRSNRGLNALEFRNLPAMP